MPEGARESGGRERESARESERGGLSASSAREAEGDDGEFAEEALSFFERASSDAVGGGGRLLPEARRLAQGAGMLPVAGHRVGVDQIQAVFALGSDCLGATINEDPNE